MVLFNKKLRAIAENIRKEEVVQRFKKKFNSLNLGRRVECGIHSAPLEKNIKRVVKNNKLCYVGEADFLGLDEKEDGVKTYTITKCYLAEEDGAFSALMFKAESDKAWNLFLDERTVVVFGDECVSLRSNADIFDVNEMRFELRNNAKIAEFMDCFVLSNRQMHEDYREYEEKQLNTASVVSQKLNMER